MEIEFLKEIYNNKELDYYVVEAWEKPCLVRVPSIIIEARGDYKKFEDLTYKEIQELNKVYIDCNLFLRDDYPPFQVNLRVCDIKKFHKVECGVKRFIELANDPNLSFYDYYTLIHEIRQEQEPMESV